MSRRGGNRGKAREKRRSGAGSHAKVSPSRRGNPRARQEGDVVGQLNPNGKLATVREPTPRPGPPGQKTRRRVASVGGFGGDMPASTIMGSGGNWYSPELSTDFLELPQSLEERRAYYKFFYENNEFVGQAIDLHTELPLSKVRLRRPQARNAEMARAATAFCEKWVERIRLLHRLLEVSHELALHGEAFVFVEDNNPDPEPDVLLQTVQVVQDDGTLQENVVERPDAQQRYIAWMKKHYKGWTDMYVVPAEQVRMDNFSFTKAKILELIPDARTRSVIERAQQGDAQAQEIVATMPPDLVERIVAGENLPLNTDPAAGSFMSYLARRRSSYDQRGTSVLQRCLLPGTLVWVERAGVLRQVPVEKIRPDTDLALTHLGRLCPFGGMGRRPVAEKVVSLLVKGISAPVRMTADHEVLRVTEHGDEWVPAGQLQPGDVVAEPRVQTGRKPRDVIDLAAWWRRRRSMEVQHSRRSGVERVFRPEVERIGAGMRVHLNRIPGAGSTSAICRITPKKQRLLRWVGALREPTAMSVAGVAAQTGLSANDVRNHAHILRKKGLLYTQSRVLGRGKGKVTIWHPLPPAGDTGAAPGPLALPDKSPRVTLETSSASIPLDEGFLYVLGAWYGAGDAAKVQDPLFNLESIGWTFEDDQVGRAVRDRVRAQVSRLFGCDLLSEGVYSEKVPHKVGVRLRDPLLSRFFCEEFGGNAADMRIPTWVFDLRERERLAFLRGVLDANGCLIAGDSPRIEVAFRSKLLVNQLHLVCNALQIHTNVYSHARGQNRGASPRVVCGKSTDVRRWASGSVKFDFWPVPHDKKHAWAPKFDGQGRYLRRVADVKLLDYAGPVYSFDVQGDHSHVTGGVITHNCLRTLVFRDKLRQAQTSIASRHMTPYRVVWAEALSIPQLEDLRLQVDQALQDPDYSIVTNFQVNWEEKGGGQENRLLDLTSEYDVTDRQLYAGLGVTESLLSGESSYSGDRINLEVLNVRFLLVREVLSDFINYEVLKPMCARMGFVEQDEDGNDEVVFPRLSFTRLALRDNQEVFETMFNMYSKGSLDVETIYDLLNIDPDTVQERLKRDLFTLNDATFNEFLRGIYGALAQQFAEGSNVGQKVAETLGLKFKKPAAEGESGGRF